MSTIACTSGSAVHGTLTLVRPGWVVKLMSMGLLSMRPVKRPPCGPRETGKCEENLESFKIETRY